MHATEEKVIHPGCRVTRIEQSRDRVVVTLADGSQRAADIVIGADGVHSTVRRQIFHGTEPEYAGYVTWRGIATGLDLSSRWPSNAIVRTLGCGRYFGIGDLGDGRHLWYLTENRAYEPAVSRSGNSEVLDLIGEWAWPAPDVVAATPDDAILLHPVHRLRGSGFRWFSARVALLGDAAHGMDPALGMGAALALEDAVELSRCLESHGDHVEAFRRYESRRRGRVARLARWSRILARSEQASHPLTCGLRDISARLPLDGLTLRLARKAMTFAP